MKINAKIARMLKEALANDGYDIPQLTMLLAQAAHETNGFNHKLALENNNFAGIKYTCSLKDVAAPSSNYFAPGNEDGKSRVPYACFKDVGSFIKCWVVYAHLTDSIFDNKIGAPLRAANLEEFALRLKLNHYYQDSVQHYLTGLQYWQSQLQEQEICC